MESIPRYFIPPADHFFLLGPRGTGKTWLTQRLFPQALRIDLPEPEFREEFGGFSVFFRKGKSGERVVDKVGVKLGERLGESGEKAGRKQGESREIKSEIRSEIRS